MAVSFLQTQLTCYVKEHWSFYHWNKCYAQSPSLVMWTVWFMEIWHLTHNITAKNVNGYRSCLSTFKNLTYRSNRLPVAILSVAKRGLTALGISFFFQLYGQVNVLLHCIKNELCNFLQLKLQSLIRPCINTDNFTTILSYFVPSPRLWPGTIEFSPHLKPLPKSTPTNKS